MKRNMELVREILKSLSEFEHGYAPQILDIADYTQEQIGYHCFILGEAELIEAADQTTSCSVSPLATAVRLTWEGHEFIDNAANEEVWGQTKGAISKLGDVSFSVWANVLSTIVMKNLGLSS